MVSYTVVKYFARVLALCEEQNIRDGLEIFNLDDTGFSIRGMGIRG